MSNQRILELNEKLRILNTNKGIEDALNVAIAIASWFGTYKKKSVFPSDQRKEATKNWFFNAIGRSDLPATYALELENQVPIDFKLFWVKKTSKQIISGVTRFTSNFEDETFFNDLNIGIDFIVPPETDRVIIALSKGYIVRTLEIGKKLTVTQEEILHKWVQEFDYTNKAYTHEILWESFSLKPLNDKFYEGISQFFQELVQHNESSKVSLADSTHFTNRLIGRILFCWFLRKKNIIAEEEFEYFDTQKYETSDKYYISKLRELFFNVLNTPMNLRKHDRKTPYLNGGLFEEKRVDKLNEISFPDSYFQRLYNFLGEYNFTTDESTSSFQQIAVDPEMLGKIFEKLLAKEVRKEKGAFYTPREIVDYMCKQSLKLHLETKLTEQRVSESELEKINEALFEKTDSDIALYEKNAQYDIIQSEKLGKRNEIIKSLKDLKVLDPACGSGAFPMGMLQLIISCYERIKAPEAKDLAELKKNVIANNLYGVDIEPMAVEITRLRAWLSIIVDEMDSSKIEPLPNLDFKFVCANSLIPLKEESNLFDKENLDVKLQKIRNDYFKASTKEDKEDIKGKFNYLTKNGQFRAFSSEREKQLQSYKPFDSDNVCEFFDPKFMFGVSEGFDVVIGNPPYVKEYTQRSAFNGIRDSKYYKGKMDLWYFFSCICIDLLKAQGQLVFIAQSNWITSYGASIFREKILNDCKIITLVDFGSYMVFENADIQTMIMQFKKTTTLEKYTFNYKRLEGNDLKFNDSIDLINNARTPNTLYLYPLIDKDQLMGNSFSFVREEETNIFEKMTRKSIFLIESEVANGIHTHHDCISKSMMLKFPNSYKKGQGIFVLKDEELKGLNLSSNEMQLIKPFYEAESLNGYYSNRFNLKWIIYTNSQFKDPNSLNQYGTLKKHLDKFANVITSDNKPYGLHRARDERFFKGEKIIVQRKCAEKPIFTYTDYDCYVSAAFYIIKTERIRIKYLLGLLNSKLIRFWLNRKGKMQGQLYQIDKEPILNIPICNTSEIQQLDIIKKVNEILSITQTVGFIQNQDMVAQAQIKQNEIDLKVYKLYDLTDEEIKIVEESVK